MTSLVAPGIAATAELAIKSPQRFTLYSVPTAEQYNNYSDDRQRGYGNNPFGNFKDTTSKIKRTKTGPFPGDLEYFELAVFKDAQLKKRIGTATVTCQFSVKKLAFCNAHYQLNDGELVGAGLIDFKIPNFAIAIVGGTGKYDGLRGELDATPAAHRSQQLAFELYAT
jgi:allene oxide cyclase-like protein